MLRPPRVGCPACGSNTIRLSRFSTRRRRNFQCPDCGARAESVIPAWPFHLANTVLGVMGSLSVPGLFAFWFMGKWLWMLWVLAALVVSTGAVHVWYGRIAVLRRVDANEPTYRRRFENPSFDSGPR
jgi:hypothetical protein